MPRILPANAWLWEAWDRLSSTRPRSAQGWPEFVLFQEMWAYCELCGISDPALREWLVYIICTLDQMYVPAVRAHLQASAPKK